MTHGMSSVLSSTAPVSGDVLLVCSHFSAGAPDVQLQRIAWATFVAVFVLVAMVFFLVRSLSCQ